MKTIHVALLATTALFAVPAVAQTAPVGPPAPQPPVAAPVTPLSPHQDGGAPADAGPTPVTEADVAPDIVVTGSRVRGAAPVGSTVISLGREDVIASGAVTTDRLIKQIPQVFDLGVSENSRGQSGGNGNITYGNSVNLRGIGPYATLILVDGHRVVNNSRSFDPSAIPTLGLERVEVVADGASAIYGSDAVAGVVNLIPRRSLNGIELTGRYGTADDFNQWQVGAAIGQRWTTGQFMVAYEHVYRSNLSGDDRSFFRSDQRAFGGNDYSVTRCAPGTITAGGVTYAIPAGGLTPANAGSLIAGTTNRCNDLIGQDLIPEQQYDSGNMTLTQEFGDRVTLFADGFYSKRKFVRQPASQAATLTVPQTNAFFVRPAGFTGTSYTIAYNFINDLPINRNPGSATNWQITPGVRVKLFGDFEAEGIFSLGRGNDQSNTYRGVTTANLNAALASSDPALAFDPYGLGRTSSTTLERISNSIFLAPTLNKFQGYEARLNGTLFQLPGGGVKLATGYEGQEIRTSLGSARGVTGTPIVFRKFQRRVDSVYAELLLPIFSADNAMAGFQKLDVNVALRHDKYSDVGKTTNPKVGVTWSPTRGVSLRGSYGTSFRAPLISQIYGNSNNLFVQTYQNPSGSPIVGVALSGANLDLKPEEATTWSVGADVDVGRRLRLSATYFNVDYTNQVEAYLSDLAILSREQQFAGTGIIFRGTDAATRVAQLISSGIGVVGSLPTNVTLFVDGRNNNLGKSETRGIDFVANYTLPTDTVGTFQFNLSGTYLTHYKVAITENAPLIDRRNTIFFPLKFKARGAISWDLDPIKLYVQATHVNGYTNNAVAIPQKVKSYTPIDASISWDIGGRDGSGMLSGLTLGAEVRNMFDIKPPYVNLAPSGNGSGGYDATVASPIGRELAVTIRAKY
ncbi:iron complex outermembrane receptor protein [Sphingomonas kaistensis]|uniref:Iron complex outermembrane receptor protein n=1 Tax=Sphingomonas kaistensis TaxID=298708 RepID=A0A7X5Y4H6_9SPHN|nr:TonB-dependent receptor [Sphingomonas kaistensis]NJC04382.1 iron complex outermembrane receptor protein [Sphingomonas kaistensis]